MINHELNDALYRVADLCDPIKTPCLNLCAAVRVLVKALAKPGLKAGDPLNLPGEEIETEMAAIPRHDARGGFPEMSAGGVPMIERKVFCDRCGNVILEQHSVIGAKAGLAASRFPECVDLCESCLDRFSDWLRGGKQQATVPDKLPTITR